VAGKIGQKQTVQQRPNNRYTTNAIESINAQLRKIIKTLGHFPTDEAATKLIWLGLRKITANWGHAAPDWKVAMNQFAILYRDRFPGRPGKQRPA
jgi:transposase-like protein